MQDSQRASLREVLTVSSRGQVTLPADTLASSRVAP
jgi:bifunctional DNA-binding transcriptional regulator/antitoxin component of YhaV-PrlF toxin-antitoxin module